MERSDNGVIDVLNYPVFALRDGGNPRITPVIIPGSLAEIRS
jgi:hypothetical protein